MCKIVATVNGSHLRIWIMAWEDLFTPTLWRGDRDVPERYQTPTEKRAVQSCLRNFVKHNPQYKHFLNFGPHNAKGI